jgi:hypothetical protein
MSPMFKPILLGCVLGALSLQLAQAEDTFLPETDLPANAAPIPAATYSFDQDVAGAFPKLFEEANLGEGTTAQWIVKTLHDAPSRPNGLTQKALADGKSTLILLLKSAARSHGEVAIRFKTLSTSDQQISGIVYKYQDPKNYYLLATSTRDDTCSLYRVKNGKRKEIDSKPTLMAPLKWHHLRLVFSENTFTTLLNDEAVMGGKEKSTAGGRVGLFVAGPSQVVFDDFQVSK